ncbi:MAG: DUF3570 domain-containing protein [Deltaproteobacteria bacterium]|nr:DUF3570 domain-containing protein [Deltaproteobacteria bacterium]
MQLNQHLRRALAGAITIGALLGARAAVADDHVEVSSTWYQEKRAGGRGGLTVISPMFDLGFDLGSHTTVDLGYSADAVTGATATVYSVDAVTQATTFSDFRNEGKLGLTFTGKRSTFGMGALVGTERDYVTLAVSGGGSIDLPGKNTTLALSYTHNRDQVCDKDNAMATILERRALSGLDPCDKSSGVFGKDRPGTTVWHDVSIDTAQASVTQNLSPTMNMQLALWGQIVEGFQSSPYRRVRVGPNEPQENQPETRARVALSVRINRYLPGLKAALHAGARVYDDTWGVTGGAVDMGWSQYFGQNLILDLHGRLSQQTAAAFFKDAFFYETESTAGAYFTGDRELSPVRNILVGAKLAVVSIAEDDKQVWGIFDRLQFGLKGDLLSLDQLPADRVSENQAGTADQFLTGGFLNAFVVQLSLLAQF